MNPHKEREDGIFVTGKGVIERGAVVKVGSNGKKKVQNRVWYKQTMVRELP